jgi:hypothetical protein
MTKKFISYIEADFVKEFYDLKNRFDLEDESQDIEIWCKLKSFFKSRTRI